MTPVCTKWKGQAGWRRPLGNDEGPLPGLLPKQDWTLPRRAGLPASLARDGDRAGAESEPAEEAGPPSAEDTAVSTTPRTRSHG